MNPNYYHSYPYLFAAAFGEIKEQLPKLNIAGFLLFKHVMETDRLLDEGIHNPDAYIRAAAYNEEGIKILSRLFSENSEFWKLWGQRKIEYKQAYKLDKSQKISSFDEYEIFADYKSSFGKVAIDALHILSKNENDKLYEDLLESHKLFSAGVQLVDDILDIREDLDNGQFNMAYFTLKNEFNKRDLTIGSFTVDQIAKQLYIFNVAEQLFERSLTYYLVAEKIAIRYNLEYWSSAIRERYNDALMKKLDAYAFKEHLTRSIILKKEGTSINKNPSIENGIEYIESCQNNDGSWIDFYNGAGLSDTWTTAFVLCNLGHKSVKEKISLDVLEKGCAFINNMNEWGYNKEWIPDADSSSFALLSQFMHNQLPDNSALQKWQKYQSKDGGVVTYNNSVDVISSLNSGENIDVGGWINSHTCVSAAAYYFLSMADGNSQSCRKLEDFMLQRVNEQGLWDAYWWTSPIYSTSFMIKSLPCCFNNSLKEKIIDSMEALLQFQSENGSFGDQYEKESPFYTSLVIDAFCQHKELYQKSKIQIDKAAQWLLSEQRSNGSWLGTPVLRMPAPEVMEPKNITSWPVGTRGNNIRVVDFNRLFTTSMAVSALSNYNIVVS